MPHEPVSRQVFAASTSLDMSKPQLSIISIENSALWISEPPAAATPVIGMRLQSCAGLFPGGFGVGLGPHAAQSTRHATSHRFIHPPCASHSAIAMRRAHSDKPDLAAQVFAPPRGRLEQSSPNGAIARSPRRGQPANMADSDILAVVPLGFQWPTLDPFLFCVHHDDAYPAGNDKLGPAASLDGRDLGMDFAGKDGWRMYHGSTVPGFPQHPHRGFETVTIVRRGLLDHSDSLGAAARYGRGDVQWLTAGAGIQHAQMFPLLERDAPNPVELFQIWMNLPAVDKMAQPHFTMLWDHVIPRRTVRDAQGRQSEITVIAGRYGDVSAASPPPSSWAARADSDVAIWTLKLPPNARFTLPAAA